MRRKFLSIVWGCVFFLLLGVCPVWSQNIIYVDASATGANDGSSWTDAYTDLQSALTAGDSNDEIWVAAGTYKPTTDPNRLVSFVMKEGVDIYGGFAGTETTLDQRNWDENQTILSGDLLGNDNSNVVRNEPTRLDNSYHVLVGSNASKIDGFTIKSGNADCGGGIFNYTANPIVTNCKFIANLAYNDGGGMYNYQSSPTVTNCTFSENNAHDGAGVYNSQSFPIVSNCIFCINFAHRYSGGIYNHQSSPIVTDCTFSENVSLDGSGMYNYHSEPTVIDCTFSENSASYYGGGMVNSGPNSTEVFNCIFRSNEAKYGGGMSNRNNISIVSNCIFSGNIAGDGSGMHNYWYASPILTNCTFIGNKAHYDGGGIYNEWHSQPTATNCVIWGNIASDGEQVYNSSSTSNLTTTYSDIEGGWPGEGNINMNPLFADVDANDFHLKSQAGRWDANSQSWVIDANTSPCIDSGDWMTPVGFEPFPNGGHVNMGAYGRTIEASKSYFGKEPCQTIIAGDINGDCKVDFTDFAIMAIHWQEDRSN